MADAMRGAIGPDGYLLIPVVGGSGTGKSHLVRWVYEQTGDTSSWETRYLAKNRTSIRRVVELVVEGMHGSVIDAAREALESAPAHFEAEEILAERLLDELAIIIAEKPTYLSAADSRHAQLQEKIRQTLPDVFRDPIVRRRFTATDAVIPRLVGLAMRGRRDGDGLDNDAKRVNEDDLPLAFDDLSDATPGVRKILRDMNNLTDLRQVALETINEALRSAVKRVFLSNSIDLLAVFRDIRREIYAQGKELVLFIEDLTVLHGVEREFLDAIVEPASSPEGRLCNLRILFAITRGHFDSLDTVRTRCDDAYWLDAEYGSDGIDLDEAASFLGRYLNSCRLDPQELENGWTKRTDGASLVNACHTCAHHDRCHESFGVSREGYGLYPLNEVAVDRLVSCLSESSFDPRQVVRKLIREFLPLSAVELETAAFPSEDLVGAFNSNSEPVRAEIVEALRRERSGEVKRLVGLLRYWSDDREYIAQTTLAAFGIAPLTPRSRTNDVRRESTRRGHNRRERTRDKSNEVSPDDVEVHMKAARLRMYQELRQWSGQGQDLGQAVTNDLRKLIHKAVRNSLDVSGVPLNLGSELTNKYFSHEQHILIEGSVTGWRDSSEAFIHVRRDPSTAVALTGLIISDASLQHLDQDDDQHRLALAAYLEDWTRKVATALDGAAPDKATGAVEGLLVASMVLGSCSGAERPEDYLNRMFADSAPGPHGHRSQAWQAAVSQARDIYTRSRPTVEAFYGEARGISGGVRALRADRMLPHMRQVLEQLGEGILASSDAAVNRFFLAVRRAVDEEWDLLCQRANATVPLIDSDRPLNEQVQRVLELVDTATRSGRFGDIAVRAELESKAKDIPKDSIRSIRGAATDTASETTFAERIGIVAGSLPTYVLAVSEFADRANSMMNAIESDLNRRTTETGGPNGLAQTMSDIESALTDLVEAVDGVVV